LRVVADTNVVLSALLWAGTPGEVLVLARDGEIQLYTSKALLDALREVLHRRKFAKQVKRTGRAAADLFRDYRRLARRVTSRQLTNRIARDVDDDAVLACALAARADLIVSGDDDLLSLKVFRSIDIVTPRRLARKIQILGLPEIL